MIAIQDTYQLRVKEIMKIRLTGKTKWILEALLFLLIYSAIQLYQKRDVLSGPAPVLRGVSLQGREIDSEQLKGAYLVHFWATWCGVCRLEHGSIGSIARDYPVIAVATQSGSRQEVASEVRKQSISFDTLVDESGDLAKKYAVRGFPTTYIVDPSGNIRYVEIGYTTEAGLRTRLRLAQE